MSGGDLWEIEPHTQAKHGIYRAYLDAWYPILSRRVGSQLTYAEGFAGRGVYIGGEPGSPIIALERLLARRRYFPNLARARFLLVEKDPHNAACLAGQLAGLLGRASPVYDHADDLVDVRLRVGRCDEVFLPLLTEAGAWGHPILAVFDTYGGGVPIELVARVAHNPMSEIIYTLQPGHFARFHTQARGDEVFGSELWRDVEARPTAGKHGFITDRLSASLRAAGLAHVVRFDLLNRRRQALNLLFGTNHPLGVRKFKEALWRTDPVEGSGYTDPQDREQQMLPLGMQPSLAPLRRVLRDYLGRQPGVRARVDQLKHVAELSTTYRGVHVPQALTEMRERGLIARPEGRLATGATTVTLLEQPPGLFG